MTRPRRLLVVCQHYWPESFRLNDMVAYFRERGVEVDVLCGLPNYPSGKFAEGYSLRGPYRQTRGGVQIFRVPEVPRGDNSNVRISLNYLSFPAASLLRVPQLLTRHYDAVLSYQLSPVMMSIAAVIISKLKRIPLTMYVLDLWPENMFSVMPLENPVLRTVLTRHSHWYYRRADRLVALTRRMAARLGEVTGRAPDSIPVLPQAPEKVHSQVIVDDALVARFRDTFNVVFTGNISPAQSFDTMVAAAELLKDRGLDDVAWVIVGDGMSRTDAEAAVDVAGLRDRFTFEGMVPLDDVPKYTHIADALVGCLVTSDLLEATIPAKVLSYVAAGKPVVLAMDGEVRELIEDQIGCGIVGPTEDAIALADAIQRLHDLAPEERAAMGARARAYQQEHLDRDVLLARMVDVVFGETL